VLSEDEFEPLLEATASSEAYGVSTEKVDIRYGLTVQLDRGGTLRYRLTEKLGADRAALEATETVWATEFDDAGDFKMPDGAEGCILLVDMTADNEEKQVPSFTKVALAAAEAGVSALVCFQDGVAASWDTAALKKCKVGDTVMRRSDKQGMAGEEGSPLRVFGTTGIATELDHNDGQFKINDAHWVEPDEIVAVPKRLPQLPIIFVDSDVAAELKAPPTKKKQSRGGGDSGGGGGEAPKLSLRFERDKRDSARQGLATVDWPAVIEQAGDGATEQGGMTLESFERLYTAPYGIGKHGIMYIHKMTFLPGDHVLLSADEERVKRVQGHSFVDRMLQHCGKPGVVQRDAGGTAVEVQFGSDARLALKTELLSVAPEPLLDAVVDYTAVFATRLLE
jgi:hypothetical protein